MLNTVKNSQDNTENISKELYDTIYKKVTKKTHNHESPKKNGDGTIKKCIELFKKGADPNILSKLEESLNAQIELEKSLKKKEEYQKHYKYCIEKFLPPLKAEVMKSEELTKPSVFNNEGESSQRSPTIRGEILGIIEKITSRRSDKDHFGSTMQNQNTTTDAVEVPSGANTSKLSSGSDLDSGIESPRTNEESLESPVSSRRSSVSSILSSAGEAISPFQRQKSVRKKKHLAEVLGNAKSLDNTNTPEISGDLDSVLETSEESLESPASSSPISVTSTSSEENLNSTSSSAEEDNNPQKEETESQVQTKQTVEGEIKIPASATWMTDDDREKDPVKSEEKKDKKNTTTTVQKSPANKNNSEDTPPKKQPNNRNLHVAASCALSTIGCIVAGAMISGLVGAGLLAMAAVFAIAAVAELRSNFLSSKLTSISVEPHVNDKELTACSRL